jgi:hypothetical protein
VKMKENNNKKSQSQSDNISLQVFKQR